jgi:hypothetical protein
MPGLGVVLLETRRIDPVRSLYVGGDAGDRALARALSMPYRHAADAAPAPSD